MQEPWSVVVCAGTRPNLVKVAPLLREMAARGRFSSWLVHTGQHYDPRLSQAFFDDLCIPSPDSRLGVGSGSHASQTAHILLGFEPVLEKRQPHAVLVVGDVNSTVACALAAAKFERRAVWSPAGRRRPLVAHVEAGLRSGDLTMPEEVNRRVTGALADLHLVSEPSGLENLAAEGVPTSSVFHVGNVMIDSLHYAGRQAEASEVVRRFKLSRQGYLLVTLHRPSNVDDPEQLRGLLRLIDELEPALPIVFAVHPRTRARMEDARIRLAEGRWIVTEPLAYLEFLSLQKYAKAVFTDSGGIQEETTALSVPCVTLRDTTERPSTIHGTNVVAGAHPRSLVESYRAALAKVRTCVVPALWDGKASQRILDVVETALERETASAMV